MTNYFEDPISFRCKDTLATEIVEDLTGYLESIGLLRPLEWDCHRISSFDDIPIVMHMVRHVESQLDQHVKEYTNFRKIKR